ncbi:MAG: sugar nucleotide-binding protein [bacterium]|nr:sugar nucleotide-binding protein [bacterium]
MADPLGTPVIGLAREPAGAPRFTSPRDAVQMEAVDLGGDGTARVALERFRPAVVVHCAALARGGDCERDPVLAQRMNVELPGEVAEWCAENGARLVHVSTDLVFGARDAPRRGFDEGAEAGPVSVYGRTKREGEELVLERHPEALVVRLPLLYGNSGGRGLGASDSVLEAVDRDEVPKLFVDEWRTPLEVGCAAAALIELAHLEQRGVLHVAGPDRVSRLELGMAVLEAMGIAESDAAAMVHAACQSDVAAAAPRPCDVSLDAGRARALLRTELLGVAQGMRAATR